MSNNRTPEEKLNLPKPPSTPRPIAIIGHGSLGTSVVKQSLTTESDVKDNSTPEEKAREYAEARYGNETIMSDVRGLTEEIFLSGYHSRDEEVKELREVLKEIVEQIYKCPLDLSSDEKVEEATYLDATIKQAKQLLNNE